MYANNSFQPSLWAAVRTSTLNDRFVIMGPYRCCLCVPAKTTTPRPSTEASCLKRLTVPLSRQVKRVRSVAGFRDLDEFQSR